MIELYTTKVLIVNNEAQRNLWEKEAVPVHLFNVLFLVSAGEVLFFQF